MSEPLSTESYKGVRDFYPCDWAKMHAMFKKIRSIMALWGYEEYNASPLERAEIYEAKTSEEIVRDQTYTFMDRGDRRVTLRPEMTPTLARMVAGKRRELTFPLRWFSIPNVFRYERPQRGRSREHYQLNVDLIGLPDGEADNEILTLISKIFESFGAKESDFIIRVNSRELLNMACKASGLTGEKAKRYLHLLDRKSKMTSTEFASALSALSPKDDPFLLIENSGTNDDVAREKRKILDRVELLKTRGVNNVIFDASITRGFDYYTGMVFEVYDTNPANPRSLFGGGRYDNLISLFSSKGNGVLPAVGFGMGDITLADFIETHKLSLDTNLGKPQLYIGTPTPDNIPSAQKFADILRTQNCRIFVNLTDRPLGDQIKEAVKREIPLFIAYGADEVANNTVRMKILATGEEIGLPISEIPTQLRSGFRTPSSGI